MDLKIIGTGALINAVSTVALSLIFLPLFLLGPVIGGFFAAYLSEGYEDYDKMDKIDGAVVGGISGLVGGSIVLLFILGFGAVNASMALISTVGSMAGSILVIGFLIFKFLGVAGGIIGVFVKE